MKKKKRNKLKNRIDELEYKVYGDFAFIAGITEAGFPFGVLKVIEEEDEADMDFDLTRSPFSTIHNNDFALIGGLSLL